MMMITEKNMKLPHRDFFIGKILNERNMLAKVAIEKEEL